MLYRIVQGWVRLTLILFCRKIHFSNRDKLNQSGPLLLALNHPNSFFDAVLVASHFKKPVHFLARGDAFRKPWVKKILTALKLIPIYRLTEGREYLALNDATFERCREILLNDGIVLIFAEGLCVNQWQLRSLKKGAARIAVDAWSQPAIAEIFAVQPVCLNYDSFNRFGKRVLVHFPDLIQKSELTEQLSAGDKVKQFNQLLSVRLKEGLIEESEAFHSAAFLIRNHTAYQGSANQLMERLKLKQQYLLEHFRDRDGFPGNDLVARNGWQCCGSLILVLLLAPFALTGFLLHAPFFYPLRNFVKKKTRGTVFYDSVLFGSLMLMYPLYWLLVNLTAILFIENMYIRLGLAAMPGFAWLWLIWRDSLERTIHFISLPRSMRQALGFI